MLDVTGLNQSGSPMIAFTWNIPQVEDDTVYRYSTEEQSMQFKGIVEKQPVKILLDTRASGTAFIDIQFCKDENIPLYPAPPNIHIVFGNSSKVQATSMAVVTVRMGHYKCKVECLVVEDLADFPLILGNPWLNQHYAELFFQRKQVIIQRPNGKQFCLNSHVDKPTHNKEDTSLCMLGDKFLVHKDLPTGFELATRRPIA
jgi:hypothetical protein